jgi:1-acyl-sn-glycerol-3-phosphate acyltransferase
MTYPAYPSVNATAFKTIIARLLHRKRSLRSDSLALCAKVSPPIHYTGLENLPAHGPLLLTANHYSRPGFSTSWIAGGISAVLPMEVTWIMSDEWLFEGNRFAFILRPLMRFVLYSITLSYGFLPMPTMVQGYSTLQERSAGVRGVIQYLRAHPDAVLGLTPEGMDVPGGGLGLPPSGAGRFIYHLNQMGLPILPISVCEKDGCLQIHFGRPFSLINAEISPSEVDLAVRRTVMRQISQLLD